MSSQGSQMPPKGPPYAPQTWSLGGKPNKNVDVPITAVFLALFIGSAVWHMTIFQLNQRRGHKFIISGLLFGFSMARIVACIMRISSVSLPTDVPLAIAANIFVAAGVVILYVVNILFTQRVIRAAHPKVGWHKGFEAVVKILIALVIIMIIMLITVVIQSFYTLNPRIRQSDRDVQLLGLTYFAFVSFVPIPVVIIALLLPRQKPVDKFGTGKWRSKIWILLIAAVLINFGASYRAGVQYLSPRSMKLPIYPAMHKGAFYVVNFTVEIIILYMYAFTRVDQRFHIPNGARNGYRSQQEWKSAEQKAGDEESRMASMAESDAFYRTNRDSSSINDSKTVSSKPGTPYTNKSRFSNEAPSMPEWPLRSHEPSWRHAEGKGSNGLQEAGISSTSSPPPQQQHFWSEYGGYLPRTPRTEARIAALQQAHATAEAQEPLQHAGQQMEATRI